MTKNIFASKTAWFGLAMPGLVPLIDAMVQAAGAGDQSEAITGGIIGVLTVALRMITKAPVSLR